MSGLRYLAVGLGLTVLAFWAVRHDVGPAERRAPPTREHVVAFDNLYGDAAQLPVYVTVDGLGEQKVTAACDAKTCTFSLAMRLGVRELLISVDHNGQRSEPSRVRLDTRFR